MKSNIKRKTHSLGRLNPCTNITSTLCFKNFPATRGERGIAPDRGVPGAAVWVHFLVPDPWPPNSPTVQRWEGAAYYPTSPSLQHPGQVQRQYREGNNSFIFTCLWYSGCKIKVKSWCWKRFSSTKLGDYIFIVIVAPKTKCVIIAAAFCICLINTSILSLNTISEHTSVSFTFRNIKPTKRTFSKGSSWPNCLRTSSFASKDSQRITSLWKRTPQLSTSPSRKCYSYAERQSTKLQYEYVLIHVALYLLQ